MNLKKDRKEIVVFGVGKLGSAIIRTLAAQDRYYLIAIDKNTEAAESVKDVANTIIVGDSTEEEFLDNVGIENADVFVIAIGDDLESSILLSSLLQDKFDGRVIVRSEDRVHRTILKKLGINTIINPNLDSSQKIANELAFPKINSNLQNLEIINIDENVVFGKIVAPPQFLNKAVKDLNIPKQILIAMYIRKEVTHIVNGDTILEDGDEIYLLGDNKYIQRIIENISEN